MKKALRILIYSIIIWIIGFAIGMILWPIHDTQFMLFKSILNVAGIILSMVFLNMYFKKIKSNYLREGILIGIIWLVVNIALDLIVLVGFLGSPLIDYLISPGIIYLNMPVLSIGVGYMLDKKNA